MAVAQSAFQKLTVAWRRQEEKRLGSWNAAVFIRPPGDLTWRELKAVERRSLGLHFKSHSNCA